MIRTLNRVIVHSIAILKVTIHTIFRVFGSQFYKDIKKKKWLLMKNRAPLHPHHIIIERSPCSLIAPERQRVEHLRSGSKRRRDSMDMHRRPNVPSRGVAHKSTTANIARR